VLSVAVHEAPVAKSRCVEVATGDSFAPMSVAGAAPTRPAPTRHTQLDLTLQGAGDGLPSLDSDEASSL
jgi:hypothetical protein